MSLSIGMTVTKHQPTISTMIVADLLDRQTIERQQELFFVQTASAGYEGIDIQATTEAGIWVAFAPAADTGNAISVAELAVMLLMICASRLNRALASMRDRHVMTNHLATALLGKTACIVGLGAIGRALAERLGHRIEHDRLHCFAISTVTLPPAR